MLFNLNKKKAYGEDSTDLEMVVKMRGTKPSLITQFIEDFKRKLEEKNWGSVYEGDDGRTYISLNLEKKENIEMFIQINRP